MNEKPKYGRAETPVCHLEEFVCVASTQTQANGKKYGRAETPVVPLEEFTWNPSLDEFILKMRDFTSQVGRIIDQNQSSQSPMAQQIRDQLADVQRELDRFSNVSA